jgi:RNA polymerase sigma-70 factor (ECF subfamily)
LVEDLDNIIKGCQRQEPLAQQRLYELYAGQMFGICLRYTNNEADAEDVLQDSFVKVFKKIKQFEFKGSFEGWLKRIMINTALEKYRNQYKILSINDNTNHYETDGVEDVADAINANELMTLIQQLSPRYKMVFNLYAIEGYSHKEISEILNISEGASKSNLSRARIILQEKVKTYYNTTVKIG